MREQGLREEKQLSMHMQCPLAQLELRLVLFEVIGCRTMAELFQVCTDFELVGTPSVSSFLYAFPFSPAPTAPS